MVLNDKWIREFGSSLFDTFIPEQVNPASYDLRLASKFIDLKDEIEFWCGEIEIIPGEAYLASTVEYVKMPNDVAGVLYLKSSLARRGLDHALAGWIDPGFEGNLTLELHSHRPIVLRPNDRILQIVFHLMNEPAEKPYSGRYKKQKGPTIAKPEVL
jgi:dCTP deaminase